MKKGDRVCIKVEGQGERLGCIRSIRGGLATVVLDDEFTMSSCEVIMISVNSPHINLSSAPLPSQCARPKDDPTFHYTARFVRNGRPRATGDGFTFAMEILKDGRPSGLQVEDDGAGGLVYIRGRGEERDKFEQAIEEWGRWKGYDLDPLDYWIEIWVSWHEDHNGLPNVPWTIIDPPNEDDEEE